MPYNLVVRNGVVIEGTGLPAGARRLVQRVRGIAATVVNGGVLLSDGRPAEGPVS
jgi:N-acyl-D-aspartate/D-glutamate deacylase